MKLGLGIDTGGTYTDGVIYDFHSKVIKDAKSVTVKEDLKLGIINVLDQMPRDLLEKVGMVSLSTTWQLMLVWKTRAAGPSLY